MADLAPLYLLGGEHKRLFCHSGDAIPARADRGRAGDVLQQCSPKEYCISGHAAFLQLTTGG
jgi:hypothetical protein